MQITQNCLQRFNWSGSLLGTHKYSIPNNNITIRMVYLAGRSVNRQIVQREVHIKKGQMWLAYYKIGYMLEMYHMYYALCDVYRIINLHTQ